MNIRWTARSVRVRLDDLELAALAEGRHLRERLHLPGGDWAVEVSTAQEAKFGLVDGVLCIVLNPDELRRLRENGPDGIEREGPPRLIVEQGLLPLHGSGT